MGNGWYGFFKNLIFVPFTKLYLRPKVTGKENVPASGGAILAANHLSSADTYMIPAVLPRKVIFPAKAELFTGKGGIGSKIVAWFLKAVGQVPMDRSGGKAAVDALGPITKELRSGGLIGFFPEGTRSPDGNLYKGHLGMARLALSEGVPVIPVGLVDTQFVKNRLGIPVLKNAQVKFGKPIDFSAYQGMHNNRGMLRWATDEVMAKIQELTGQTYVDVYGSRVKYGNLKDTDLTNKIKERPGGGEPPIPEGESE